MKVQELLTLMSGLDPGLEVVIAYDNEYFHLGESEVVGIPGIIEVSRSLGDKLPDLEELVFCVNAHPQDIITTQ